MSLPSKTDLEEYARQCTLQRRHYEDCVQQAQQGDTVDANTTTASLLTHGMVEETPINATQLDRRFDDTTQGCLLDLLEIDIEPLAWKDQGLDQTRRDHQAEHQTDGDRSQTTHQTVASQTEKNVSAMIYGAP